MWEEAEERKLGEVGDAEDGDSAGRPYDEVDDGGFLRCVASIAGCGTSSLHRREDMARRREAMFEGEEMRLNNDTNNDERVADDSRDNKYNDDYITSTNKWIT